MQSKKSWARENRVHDSMFYHSGGVDNYCDPCPETGLRNDSADYLITLAALPLATRM